MATIHHSNGESPARASEWLVALKERPDDAALRAGFEAWLAASPAHADDWAEMIRTSAALGRFKPAHRPDWESFVAEHRAARARADASEGRSDATSRPGLAHLRSGRRWFARPRPLLALAAAAAACLVLLAGPALVLRLEADHMTEVAEQRIVRLDDGSTVQLAPRSAIGVLYGAERRHVRLLKGEAFFEVAHDSRRPFVVEAAGLDVTALGTAFDVRLGGEGTGIAVQQGVVRVEAARAQPLLSERLEAGDWLRVASDGRVERGQVLPGEVAAWRRGRIIAKNRPVAEIVEQLRAYYDGLIVLHGADLASQPLTGVYNLSDPVDALRAVARAQGAGFHRISPWIVVLSGP